MQMTTKRTETKSTQTTSATPPTAMVPASIAATATAMTAHPSHDDGVHPHPPQRLGLNHNFRPRIGSILIRTECRVA